MNPTRAEIEQAIINTVSYVDAFNYPLTSAEIHRYLIQLPLSYDKVHETLKRSNLVPQRLRQSGDYYMLPGRENIAQARQEKQIVAEQLWPEAVRYGMLIARMPFVRMVGVTGSLAVNNVGPNVDIDYMIVTADQHLWMCRAFVILIVRWASRRGLELCPNYFLTESALLLSTNNLYTAHELAQMVPLFGLPVYQKLRRVNPWTNQYLPNAQDAPALPKHAQSVLIQTARMPGRRLLETAIDSPPGRWLDRWEMSRKVRKFRQAYPGWQEAEFSVDCCKGHFNQHQHRAIQAYERLVGEQTGVEVETDDLEPAFHGRI